MSIAGIYVAWAKFVYEPLGIQLQIRWPLTLIAAGVVFYQTIIWCLSGFRLARVIVLSVLISMLVGIGLLPSLWADTGGGDIEGRLTAALIGVTAIAYATTILTVGAQRRGGARGWELAGIVADVFARVVPEFRGEGKSADAALFWLEWRRSGLVLPAAVLLTLTLILGPILWLTGRGPDETIRAAMFLVILPVILTLAVGKGMSKPDFWSLDLSLSPFLTGRPITVRSNSYGKNENCGRKCAVGVDIAADDRPAVDVRDLRRRAISATCGDSSSWSIRRFPSGPFQSCSWQASSS